MFIRRRTVDALWVSITELKEQINELTNAAHLAWLKAEEMAKATEG